MVFRGTAAVFFAGLLLSTAVTAGDGERGTVPGAGVEERIIPLGKGRMRVLITGDPAAPPVLLLHGGTFRAELWQKTGTLDRIAAAGYRVYAPDLPGHGKSRHTGHSRDQIMWALIQALKLESPVVVGHSLGGTYALPLIARHHKALAGAVLVAPAQLKKYARQIKGKPLPVLILWGSRDKLIPVARSKTLLGLFPNGRRVILEGAGHECYLDDPEGFHGAIVDFLNDVKAKRRGPIPGRPGA